MTTQASTDLPSAIRDAADALFEARRTGIPIAPLSATSDLRSVDLAYAIAQHNIERRLAAGARAVGKKIGLTSLAVQRQLGVDQPDFGVLTDDMEYLHGQAVPMQRLIQPKVEAEVAFVIGHSLPARKPSWAEFVRSVAWVLPALEIVDSAIADWRIGLFDTVADNASSGLYVLGNQPFPLGSVALDALEMRMERNGERVSSGSGAACMGHPLRAGYWLACTMAERGAPLTAGEVVLSGALGPMVPLTAGDAIQADLGPLGRVACRME